MQLFIAEKPSVAKAIAAELKITNRGDGFLECGNTIVTWCFGHLLEQATPDAYLPSGIPLNAKGNPVWRFKDLPIFPEEWILEPKYDAKKQLKIIGDLLKKADSVVHAGDPDREGCLLVDEVLEHFKNNKPVKRFWVSAQDSTSIRRGLDSLKDNKEFKGWTDAARARSRADWLIGMNLTRAYSLLNNSLITIGRVQTPTLNIVVHRDATIKNFKPVPFYTIHGKLQHANGTFNVKWKPKENQDGLDEDGRLLNKEIANEIATKINQQSGTIAEFKQEKKEKKQPLVFSLSDITALANQKFGFSAEQTLQICQDLYEKHKLTSYPRTDCSYLPESQFDDAEQVVEALKTILPQINPDNKLISLVEKCDLNIKSKTWDDSKITAHHGIIPTMQDHLENKLTLPEKQIHELIVKQYLAQFFPPCKYLQTSVSTEVNGETLTAQGKIIIQQGWQEVFGRESANDEKKDEQEENQTLPSMQDGDTVHCVTSEVKNELTKPPKYFTEGTLIRAMENIHKFLETDDNKLKSLLKDGDGIGTSATRASIIGELKRRGFIEEKGKNIISTQKGNDLIKLLTEQGCMAKDIALTAIYERSFKQIEIGEMTESAFIDTQKQTIKKEIDKIEQAIKENPRTNKPKATQSSRYTCQKCGAGLIRRENKKNGRFFWGCSGFPECKQTYFDNNGKPNYEYDNNKKKK